MNSHLDKNRAQYLAQDYKRGFISYCGYEVQEIRRGYLKSKVKITENHRQQDGFIHAGVMATMADHTAGYAAFTIVKEDMRILTIEFKINFLKPAYGDYLICESRVIKEGNQIIIAESEVSDHEGQAMKLAAKALVTLMAVPSSRINPPAST